ncbi:hypothetical protein [Streptomyces agglomeratus]|uniref:hypothetical protein n=1 Tax=Streptomyces agglomeratus TaxID=285458 RepID=UPI00210ED455|nr:hypothetical protein [Streptomyces agglomeratus]
MRTGERETWTTEEFGPSPQGAVGVLLDDDTVPAPVFFGSNSGGGPRPWPPCGQPAAWR